MSRAIWLVLDSLGVGGAPDADAYGDLGADTFGHIASACASASRGPLRLPTLTRLGLPQAGADLDPLDLGKALRVMELLHAGIGAA